MIALPDVTKPAVTAFSIPANSTSLVVTVSSFTASDNKFYNPNKNPEDDKLLMFDVSEDDVVLRGESYYPGYRIAIVKF